MLQRLRPILILVALWVFAAPSVVSAGPELVYDRSSGSALFGRDATIPWHPASLTKIMTAYVALEAVAAGRLDMESAVVMSATALKAPPSRLGLPVGTRLRLRDALVALAVKSANDVAIAVAEAVSGSEAAFVQEMNETSRRLGLVGSSWRNPHGLHALGQVTTARDLVVLTEHLLRDHPESSAIFATHGFVLDGERISSHNGLLGRYPGVDGFKTGYVCASGFNVVVTAQRDGRQIIAVVLGGMTARRRDARAAHLVESGFATAATGIALGMLADAEITEAPDMRPLVCDGGADKESADDIAWGKKVFSIPRELRDFVVMERLAEPEVVRPLEAESHHLVVPRRF